MHFILTWTKIWSNAVAFINIQNYIFSDNALTDPEIGKFFVKERIEEYRGFGGVRIEDDIIITKDGCEVN